jgi:hypothetical protein
MVFQECREIVDLKAKGGTMENLAFQVFQVLKGHPVNQDYQDIKVIRVNLVYQVLHQKDKKEIKASQAYQDYQV